MNSPHILDGVRNKCAKCQSNTYDFSAKTILIQIHLRFVDIIMDPENIIIAETPDLDFNENQTEIVENVNYSEEQVEQIFEAMEQETPDLDFSEQLFAEPIEDLHRYTEDDEDIDDLEEPDQYVEDDESGTEDNDNDNNDGSKKTGKLFHCPFLLSFITGIWKKLRRSILWFCIFR